MPAKYNRELFQAIDESKEADVKKFIALGVDLDKANSDRNTPLIRATQKGDYSIVKLLIDAKARLDIVNKSGMTALMCAVILEREDLVELLVLNKANVNKLNQKDGASAIIYAAQVGNVKLLDLLRDNKADINVGNKMGTPLHQAANCGHSLAVKYLLQVSDAKLNSKNAEGFTPLMLAIASGDINTIEEIIYHKSTRFDLLDPNGNNF